MSIFKLNFATIQIVVNHFFYFLRQYTFLKSNFKKNIISLIFFELNIEKIQIKYI